jgi:hypothetical protein
MKRSGGLSSISEELSYQFRVHHNTFAGEDIYILCLLSREAINLRTISKLMDAKSFE